MSASMNSTAACCKWNDPGLSSTTRLRALASKLATDKPLIFLLALAAAMSALQADHGAGNFDYAKHALLDLAPWMLTAIAVAAYVQASHAQAFIARAFQGSPARMILLATLFGVLSPLCSCGVIPFVAGLLASGIPLAPVMAFWMSSPLMDPNMFLLTAATLGMQFAVVKTIAAVFMGLFGGAVTHYLTSRGHVKVALRGTGALGANAARDTVETPQWQVWKSEVGRQAFLSAAGSQAWLLARWMTIAFLLESIMMTHLPAQKVAALLGNGYAAIPFATALGIPAYLNGMASLPLVAGLVKLGMSQPVALAFLISGGVTSIPAAVAVWALVKPRVFSLYLGLAIVGSLITAYGYAFYLGGA